MKAAHSADITIALCPKKVKCAPLAALASKPEKLPFVLLGPGTGNFTNGCLTLKIAHDII